MPNLLGQPSDMADPYGIFDSTAAGVIGEMGGMRSGASYPPQPPPPHQTMMGSGGGILGMSDPGIMGGMMPQGHPSQQSQQHPNPQTMNAYGPHQGMQMPHPGVGPSPKLQHYGQYSITGSGAGAGGGNGGDYGAPPSSARLHHLGGDPSMRPQQGGMSHHIHQQMSSANSMMASMIQQPPPTQQPQYPPVHRPPLNPSQHPMYSMHNSNVSNQTQPLHQPSQQQPTHTPMQMSQGMMWSGQPQYPSHPQQQPQQHRPPQQGPSYVQQRHDYGRGVDAGGPPQRLGHYADVGVDQPPGAVPHIPHQVPGSKLGPLGVTVQQNSPYPAVVVYHGGSEQNQVARPSLQSHGYSYEDAMSHQGSPVVPKSQSYGAPYGPNGAVQGGQPYQVSQTTQAPQHVMSSHSLVSVPSEPLSGSRGHYSQAPQVVPNGSPQYRPTYPQMNLSPRRPTPTPPVGSPMPPPSHTPDRHSLPSVSASQAQGTYRTPSPSLSPSLGQSSLQQLEQMVMPHVGNRSSPLPPAPPHSSPFHSSAVHHTQVSTAPPHTGHIQTQSQYTVAGSAMESMQQPQQQHVGHHSSITNIGATVSGGGPTVPQPMSVGSPAVGLGSPSNINSNVVQANSGPSATGVAQQSSPHTARPGPVAPPAPPVNPVSHSYEMQQIQQQLHQLYNLPQSPQTHQKVIYCSLSIIEIVIL